MDQIVFDELQPSDKGWLFEARLELENVDNQRVPTDAFARYFSQPFELLILNAHDSDRPIGKIKRTAGGRITGTVDATLQRRMRLGIGFQPVKSRIEDGVRILEEIKVWEVSLFPIPDESKSCPAAEIAPR